MKPSLTAGSYLAWFLVAWLLGIFLVMVPAPVLEKLLVAVALVLSVVGSGIVRRAERLFILGVCLVLFFAFEKYLQQPAPAVLFLAAMLLVYLSTFSRNLLWKLGVINLGAAVFALALFEIYLAGWLPFGGPDLRQDFVVATATGEASGSGSIPDPELGYRNAAGAAITEAKTWKGEPLYQATYTTNQRGWRTTPNALPATAQPVLFMGCSFAFGQGVQDGETMAAAFEQESKDAFRAYNFSAPGYGPHQALRILERRIEQQAIGSQKPVAAFYVAIPDHVARSSGLRFWDQSGPRYELGSVGVAVYQGRLNDGPWGKLRELLFKAELVRMLTGNFEGTPIQEQRYVAIVSRAAKLYRERYGTPFYVFYWGDGTAPADSQRIAGLRAAGLDVITINQVLPDYTGKGIEKYLFAHDPHPLPEVQAQIGRFLAQYLSRQEARDAR